MAEDDLKFIAQFTFARWGKSQAIRYRCGLRYFCSLLAANPHAGQTSDALIPGLRRMEHQSHTVSCFIEDDSILVAPILHRQMLPSPQMFQE